MSCGLKGYVTSKLKIFKINNKQIVQFGIPLMVSEIMDFFCHWRHVTFAPFCSSVSEIMATLNECSTFFLPFCEAWIEVNCHLTDLKIWIIHTDIKRPAFVLSYHIYKSAKWGSSSGGHSGPIVIKAFWNWKKSPVKFNIDLSLQNMWTNTTTNIKIQFSYYVTQLQGLPNYMVLQIPSNYHWPHNLNFLTWHPTIYLCTQQILVSGGHS